MSRFQHQSTTNGVDVSYVEFTADTSGAVPATFTRANDIASITKGTHTMVFVLLRGAVALVDWSVHVIQATPSTSAAWEAKVTAQDVAGTAKSITVTFFDKDGTAVDMATGDILVCRFDLKRTRRLA